jgi:hypothetical protein
MHGIDYGLAKATMDTCVWEAHRAAEARNIVHQSGIEQGGWLSQQGCRFLCRFGHRLVALGEWLERSGSPQPSF